MTAPTGPFALDGLRVIDLTKVLTRPFCTMVLADQSIDVIKIEPPTGDLTRELEPFPEGDDQKQMGGYFHSINPRLVYAADRIAALKCEGATL